MTRINDLTGVTFGRLTVIGLAEMRPSGSRLRSVWLCKCSCGNQHKVIGANLTRGASRSCGCLRSEQKRTACRRRNTIPKKVSIRRLWSEDVEEFLSS